MKSLRRVLDNIIKHGKHFRYYVKASKRQLIIKDRINNVAIKVFENTEIDMRKGASIVGSVIRSENEFKTFLDTQLEEHNKILKELGKIAKPLPQNVYSCYTKSVQKNLSFLARITPNTTEKVEACEKLLQENLIPNLIGKDNISHQLRDIASLPLKMDGLNNKLRSDCEKFSE